MNINFEFSSQMIHKDVNKMKNICERLGFVHFRRCRLSI